MSVLVAVYRLSASRKGLRLWMTSQSGDSNARSLCGIGTLEVGYRRCFIRDGSQALHGWFRHLNGLLWGTLSFQNSNRSAWKPGGSAGRSAAPHNIWKALSNVAADVSQSSHLLIVESHICPYPTLNKHTVLLAKPHHLL